MKARVRRVISIGYEQRSVSDLIGALRRHRVTKLIDVRELPLSRRHGFSKTALSEALAEVGIKYLHCRAAGNPYRSLRDKPQKCLELYKGHISQNPEVLDKVVEHLDRAAVAFLCYERDHNCCHRSVLINYLQDIGHEFEVLRVE